MPTQAEEAEIWNWPRFNPPGLLVGPVPYKSLDGNIWAPDYSRPGVTQRINVETDFIETVICGRKRQ